MRVAILERGEKLTDIQTAIKEFHGTMKDYYEQSIAEIQDDVKLGLLEHILTDDEEVVIQYYSEAMRKRITFYAFKID